MIEENEEMSVLGKDGQIEFASEAKSGKVEKAEKAENSEKNEKKKDLSEIYTESKSKSVFWTVKRENNEYQRGTREKERGGGSHFREFLSGRKRL